MEAKIKRGSITRIIGTSSVALLSILMLALLCPGTSPKTYAEEATDQVTTTASLNVGSMVSVALQSQINIDVVPNDLVTFASNTAKLTINTNNTSGYSVYMQTTNGSSDLISIDSTNTRRVASITETTSQENFTANTWGYSFDTDKRKLYEPVTIDPGEAILRTEDATTQDDYDLTFGVAVGADLPMGTYNNSVVISVIANPNTITNLNQVTYMQGMTPDICRNTAEGVTKQLIDTRDGNSYWVAKLKDGNCWMTQNLALDITTEGLKATDTDISVDWNERTSKVPIATNDYTKFNGSVVASWSEGEVVMATPEYAKSCGVNTVAGALAQTCANVGFIDVSSKDWRPTFVAQDGAYTFSNGIEYEGLIAVSVENKTYDAHYLVGNHYNYYAATAGLTVAANANSTGSICPKGWRLPSGGTAAFDTNGSIVYLLRQYGLATSGTAGAISNNDYSMVKAPLYFVRNGHIGYVESGTLKNANLNTYAGMIAAYWTSTANFIYGISYQNKPNIATSENAFYGDAIRCILQSN